MTIKYLDSKRISALSSDGEGLSFSDNFSTDDWTTSSSSVIGVSGGVLNWSVPNGSVQEQQSYVDMLGSLINTTQWSIRFKLTVSGYVQGSSTQTQQLFFGISNESSSGHTNTQDIIGLKLTLTNTISTIGVQMKNATPSNTGNTSNVSTALSAGTWYVEINRLNLTQSKITLYSDSSYSQLVSTATETYSTNALNDLRYLKCSEYSNNAGTDHTLSGTIDDVSFYNGLTSIVKPTNVQDNSILVEKDTANRYWFDDAFNLTGLKSYWKFNEASGDIVNQATSVGSTDSLGTGADLQITGATYNNTNTPFNTMNFDGTNDFGQAGTSLSQFNFLHNGDKWTIACWMEIIDTSVEGTIWGNTTGTNTQGVNFLQTGATTKFLVRVFDSAIWINVDMGAHGLTDGNPFFVTLTFDKDEATQKAKYFRNGSLISSGDQSTTQGTASNSPIAFRIARSSGSVYFAVNFSEYSIWNRVLSDAEITTLYNSGSGKTLDTAKGATWTMEPTFEDDFTSYADQTAADLAWVSQETASTRVNVTNDNLAFSVTGTSNKGISYDLGVGNVSDTTWILQYTLAHTTYTNGSGYGQYWIGLSSADSATLYGGAQDSISSRYNRDTAMRVEASDNSDMGNQGGTDGVDLANNTTYYVDLIRDGTSITRNIYTDSARTGTIFSTSTLTISGTITGLRYFVLRNDSASGTSGHATGTIDDIKFYNGVTTPN